MGNITILNKINVTVPHTLYIPRSKEQMKGVTLIKQAIRE